jgi:hypothetical protein
LNCCNLMLKWHRAMNCDSLTCSASHRYGGGTRTVIDRTVYRRLFLRRIAGNNHWNEFTVTEYGVSMLLRNVE